jgi:hypothetical protein
MANKGQRVHNKNFKNRVYDELVKIYFPKADCGFVRKKYKTSELFNLFFSIYFWENFIKSRQ